MMAKIRFDDTGGWLGEYLPQAVTLRIASLHPAQNSLLRDIFSSPQYQSRRHKE
jgi:hypothetical protein